MLIVESSTLSNNSAYDSGWAICNDGVWDGSHARVELNGCTFCGDGVRGLDGIINDARFGGSAEVDLANCILTGGASGATLFNDLGQIRSLGFNLSNDGGGGLLTHATDRVNTDPLLGPLQDHGGPTFTHALLSGSPAIDAGSRSAFGVAIDLDQRGRPRTSDDPAIANAPGSDGTDIGAFEVIPPMTILKQQLKLSFARADADSFSLTALLDLGAGFVASGQVVSLVVGGATATLTLDAKGGGATAPGVIPAGRVKLAPKGKTGLRAFSAAFRGGSWQDPWSALGLMNDDVPKPGLEVTVPTAVQLGSLGFVAQHPMVYTAKADKSGTAR